MTDSKPSQSREEAEAALRASLERERTVQAEQECQIEGLEGEIAVRKRRVARFARQRSKAQANRKQALLDLEQLRPRLDLAKLSAAETMVTIEKLEAELDAEPAPESEAPAAAAAPAEAPTG